MKYSNNSTVKTKTLLFLVFLLLVTTAAYHSTFTNGWTTWDDNVYVTDNQSIRGFSMEHLRDVWTSHYNGSYLPLTMMSYMVDYTIGGYDPFVYHATNLLLHLCNTVLVFLFIYLLSNKNSVASSIVSVLFALHPMHVESVAWISARKDVLSGFFFFASLLAYLLYTDRAQQKGLLLSFFFFLLALLSKVTIIVLPLILLLIDYHVGREWHKKLLTEKIPFFLVAVIGALVGIIAQADAGAIRSSTVLESILIPHYGLVFYLEKFFLPIRLSSLYPFPDPNGGLYEIKIYLAIPFVYLIGLMIWKARRNKALLFGVLFFLILILPVLQFVRFSNIFAADRFTYLSYIGIAYPLGVWSGTFYGKMKVWGKGAVVTVGVILSMLLSFGIAERVPVWKNSDTLWRDVFNKYPDALK